MFAIFSSAKIKTSAYFYVFMKPQRELIEEDGLFAEKPATGLKVICCY